VTRVLLLRALEDAVRTREKLRALGFEAVISPVLEIVATGVGISADACDAVLASSAKGIECGADLAAIRALPFHAVGAKTAEAARARGLAPDLVAGNAKALLPLLKARYTAPARFLYIAGRERQPDLEVGLAAQGHRVAVVETYDAVAAKALTAPAVAALRDGDIVAALHYSRRSVEIFLALADAAGLGGSLGRIAHLTLSADVAAPLEARGFRTQVAEKPDEAHLLRLLPSAQNMKNA